MAREFQIKVERPASLRSQLQNSLRNSILNGDFDPGDPLIERELCEASGVSRPILREALAHLEARGLIERLPSRGYAVSLPSRERISNIYEVRVALEGLAVRSFVERADAETLGQLQIRWQGLDRAFFSRDRATLRTATTEFYDILLEGCGNAEIRSALEPLLDRIAFLRTQTMLSPERRQASHTEMQALVEAISNRDAEKAAKISDQHIENARAAALSKLDDGQMK
ncbi:GntR family transcriptional regulator [Pelagivirga sediminicola]|uniref:GntR family transcriptional regulator n=1 Tax=Pelagivirga sediminicola TaxID=2170575 RepID=A0A2T7G898_9RHOB|nr:GntR family transcriptional regulator [Pelagivirga sediminicola]PVA10626.1 GntR family transcriptional regulator [Pelagivirga sediminicola]